jgi:hypothetical protein
MIIITVCQFSIKQVNMKKIFKIQTKNAISKKILEVLIT